MIETSELWQEIFADEYHQTKTTLQVDGVEIPDTRIAAGIYAPTMTSAIYTDNLEIGNCVSSCLELVYLPEADPPRGAKVELFCTIYPRGGSFELCDEYSDPIVDDDGEPVEADTAESIRVGTWKIDQRSKNKNGWLTLTCFDPLERLDRVTVLQAAKKCGIKVGTSFTAADGATLLCAYTGMTCDNLPNNASFTREELEQLSLRAFAGYLAAQAGGNLAADETASHLKLLPLKAAARPDWYLTDENEEEVVDETGAAIFAVCEETRRYFPDQYRMEGLEDLGTFPPITGVEVVGSNAEEETYLAGADTGTVLTVSWPFASASLSLAEAILPLVEGYIHQGWQTDRVVLDPALQIGDPLVVDNRETVLAELFITIRGAYVAGAGAAAKEATDYE